MNPDHAKRVLRHGPRENPMSKLIDDAVIATNEAEYNLGKVADLIELTLDQLNDKGAYNNPPARRVDLLLAIKEITKACDIISITKWPTQADYDAETKE